MERAWCKCWSLAESLWPVAVGAAVTVVVWIALEGNLKAQLVSAAAALVLFAWWFADGVVNWRRKCVTCKGAGAFNSKISARLNRPCSCCDGSPAGGGRHPTLRSRIWHRKRS